VAAGDSRMVQLMSLTLLFTLLVMSASAQDLTPEVRALTNRPDVARAMAYPGADRDRILEEWKSLSETNAPSGKERERAEAVRKILETCMLDKVYYDSKGNLVAIRKGTGGRKAVVMMPISTLCSPNGVQ
jgi:tripeptide aminopeptidase